MLEANVAIVTGAGPGLGRVLAFVRQGAHVVAYDITEEGEEETVRMIREATTGAEAEVVGDVTNG